jgi:hypothetical protein
MPVVEENRGGGCISAWRDALWQKRYSPSQTVPHLRDRAAFASMRARSSGS